MRTLKNLFLVTTLLFSSEVVFGSQLVSIEVSKLAELSDVIIAGTVNSVVRDENSTVPEMITGYDIVTVETAIVLKGSVSANEIKVHLATRGNRAFDPMLKKDDVATFYLKLNDDGSYRTAYPGSIALFPEKHFTKHKK